MFSMIFFPARRGYSTVMIVALQQAVACNYSAVKRIQDNFILLARVGVEIPKIMPR
jgi:hypothetical protein